MRDLSHISLEELIGDLIDARLDARSCTLVLRWNKANFDLKPAVKDRIDGNLRQIKLITAELLRRGITYKSVEACP